MERYINMVVTASLRIKFDDSRLDYFDAYEETREQLNTHLELNDTSKINIEDVRLDDIQLN